MRVLGTPLLLPMGLLDGAQALANHAQTLERLNERGGVSLSEAAALAQRRRWVHMPAEDAIAALAEAAKRKGLMP
jgi:hypothetical protein